MHAHARTHTHTHTRVGTQHLSKIIILQLQKKTLTTLDEVRDWVRTHPHATMVKLAIDPQWAVNHVSSTRLRKLWSEYMSLVSKPASSSDDEKLRTALEMQLRAITSPSVIDYMRTHRLLMETKEDSNELKGKLQKICNIYMKPFACVFINRISFAIDDDVSKLQRTVALYQPVFVYPKGVYVPF